ncbi:MAG: hypothetical protein ACF8Q5_14005 [Phycisphaerales bacterium JB040]
MRLTRNQRIALGALGVAVAALVADKALLTPRGASGSEARASVAPGEARTVRKVPGSAEHLSANLSVVSHWADTVDLRASDPFAWGAVREAPARVDPLASFSETVSAWLVSSIMGTPGRRIAVINGEPVRVDESIPFSPGDGRTAKIVEIREQSVVLYHDGETITLTMPVNALSDVPGDRS